MSSSIVPAILSDLIQAGSASGLEEFVNLRGLLVQSSKWLGISSVQFSSLVTSLSGKFVQFSSGQGAKCLHSVRSAQFTQLISRALPALARIALAGSVQSIESPIVWERQRSSSRQGSRTTLGPLQQKSHRAGFVACVEG